MVVTQYPEELGVACSPTQWYPGTKQSQQNFQALPQPELLMASTGFQNLKHVVQGTVESRTANANGVPESKQQGSCPLLNSLLNGNPPDFTSFLMTQSVSSKDINADIKLSSSTYFSDKGHCKKKREKSSPAAVNCGKTKAPNLDNSGGAHFTPCQKQFAFPFLNNQPSAEKVLSVAEMVPPTDDQIQGFIAEKVAYFRTFPLKNKYDGHAYTNRDRSFLSNDMDSTSQYDYITPKTDGNAHLIANSAFDNKREKKSLSCAVTEQCNATVGQRGLTESTPKSNETDDCATSASNKCSSGTLASAEGNSEHAPEIESLERNASLDFELPDKKHLNVTMSSNGGGKSFNLDEGRTFISNNDENFHSKWCNKYLQNGVTTLHYSLTALKELIASLENVETITEMDNFPKVILQQFWNGDTDNIHLFASTEYPQIMGNVAATCTKNEDESPKVLTAVPVTWDELTEKQHNSSLNCSPSKDEYKSPWLNINQNLDDTDHVHNVSQALKHITERENGNTGRVSMQSATDVSEDLQTETGSVEYGSRTFEVFANSNLNLSTDKIQIYNGESALSKENKQPFNQTICKDSRENVYSFPSQIDASIALSVNEVKEQFPFSERKSKEALSVSTLKDLQYEDVSDDENMPQMATTVSTNGNEHPPSFKDLQYGVISKDQNSQLESVCMKRPSPTQVPEYQSQSENESDGHVQRQVQTKTKLISDEEVIPKPQISPETETLGMAQHCFCSRFVKTDDGLICAKCERPFGSQPNHSVLCSHSSVLEVEDENDDQMDDDNQMDNDWIVIPISISDLKFEPKDDNQEGTDKVYLKDNETGNKDAKCDSISLPVPAASTIEVFDTVEKFRQAKALKSKIDIFEVALDWSTPQCELDSEEELHPLKDSRESCSEPEDSCETEDSCDYSPEPERHYLTVSKQLLKKSPAPLPAKTDDSLSEKEGQDEVMDVQKGQTKRFGRLCFQNLKQLIEAKAASKCAAKKTNGQNISKTDDIIIIDSDTEESDQNCKKKQRRIRLLSSDSDSSGAASCSQQKRQSHETVDSMCGSVKQKHKTVKLQSADLTSQHQSKFHYTQCKKGMKDTCSEMSHSTEKTKQLTKSGSENVHCDQTVIILDSDIDDYNDQNYEKAKRKRLFSAGSSDVDSATCVQQKRFSPETFDSKFGTVKEKQTEIRLSFSASSLPLHKPKFLESQSEEVMQDACSYQAHKPLKGRQPTEGRCDSEHVQPTSNERANTKMILSSASEDSDDALFSTKIRPITETENHLRVTANKRTGNPRSSEKSQKQQLQSMGNEVDLIMDPSLLIPHLVQRSSQPAETVKPLKSRLHSNDKTSPTKTLTETSKNTDSHEKKMKRTYRDKKGRFKSKPKPASSGHHSIKNVIKASKKPIQVSRQLSSPSQEVDFTSSSSSSSQSGQSSDARQSLASSRDLSHSGKSSASCSLSQSNQNPVVLRQNVLPKMRLSHSYSSPSTLDHLSSPTKNPLSLTMQSSARKLVKIAWKNSYFKTRKDRRSDLEMEKNSRTTNNDLCKEARPAPGHHEKASHKRHNSHESETPLMKRTKFDAIQWTKAINRDTSRKQRYSVGDGYKWSEKQTVAKSTKGSSR